MTTSYLSQTTQDTMARIAAGGDPWICYRDFLEDWTYQPELRSDQIAHKPVAKRAGQRRWAALLAATVEALCLREGLPVPGWVHDQGYRLAAPWYLYDGGDKMRAWLKESTPEPFAARNIWAGSRILRPRI